MADLLAKATKGTDLEGAKYVRTISYQDGTYIILATTKSGDAVKVTIKDEANKVTLVSSENANAPEATTEAAPEAEAEVEDAE